MKRHKHSSEQPPITSKAQIIGFGLDAKDGHKRITQAERFAIVGGSKETHERMTETVVKTFETLDRKGKSLETIEKSELKEIIQSSSPG